MHRESDFDEMAAWLGDEVRLPLLTTTVSLWGCPVKKHLSFPEILTVERKQKLFLICIEIFFDALKRRFSSIMDNKKHQSKWKASKYLLNYHTCWVPYSKAVSEIIHPLVFHPTNYMWMKIVQDEYNKFELHPRHYHLFIHFSVLFSYQEWQIFLTRRLCHYYCFVTGDKKANIPVAAIERVVSAGRSEYGKQRSALHTD